MAIEGFDMRILLTEETEFIDGHLVSAFFKTDYNATALDDLKAFYAEGIKRYTLETHHKVADRRNLEYRFVKGECGAPRRFGRLQTAQT